MNSRFRLVAPSSLLPALLAIAALAAGTATKPDSRYLPGQIIVAPGNPNSLVYNRDADGGGLRPFQAPDRQDWVLHLRSSDSKSPENAVAARPFFFPPRGQGTKNQDRRPPEGVGLDPTVIARLREFIQKNPYRSRANARWALWRHGYLVHVEGDFDATVDVASLRKTWHALTVGAAIRQGRIPSLDQKISVWEKDLKGNDAEATWRHVITQSAGFDYPYGDFPDFRPGQMWTYSDLNPIRLCNALAKVYGKKNYRDNYADVLKEAYFDAIGMEGWSVRFVTDSSSRLEDGVRLVIGLEHMGRLGLLVLARGTWDGKELIPRWFVEELETKQTRGMRVNYNGPNDGKVGLDSFGDRFKECPYGYMTWVNTDGNYYPGADKAWAWGAGSGGTKIIWNRNNGIVFAGVGIAAEPSSRSIPHIIEKGVVAPNPLVRAKPDARVGLWDRFEAGKSIGERASQFP